MNRENQLVTGWTAQRIRNRMLKDIFLENLYINGLAQKKPQPHASLEQQWTKLGGIDSYRMGFASRLS